VYALTTAIFGSVAADNLTTAQRDAIEAVAAIYIATNKDVSLRQIADHLGIDKSAAHRRLNRPLARGYVANLEERRGRPARYRPGDTPPDAKQALPGPAVLAAAWAERHGLKADCNTAMVGSKPSRDWAAPSLQGVQTQDGSDATPADRATVETQIQHSSPQDHCTVAARAEGTIPLPSVGAVDGRRLAVLRAGQTLGWPHLPYAPGLAIAPGRAEWEAFCRANPDEVIAQAWGALGRLGGAT
jgi:hypothetical protein